MKACDDGFRKQLEAKERAFQQLLDSTVQEKDKEISALQDKVSGREFNLHEMEPCFTNENHFIATCLWCAPISLVVSGQQKRGGDAGAALPTGTRQAQHAGQSGAVVEGLE